MAVKFNFKGVKEGCRIGLVLIQPDGHPRLVVDSIVPMDGDWRADVEFYDDVEKAYRTRLRKAIGQYN